MQPQHSQMELNILVKLKSLGIPVETDRSFCLQSTTPDYYLPTKNLAIYLDGPVHEGREDRDDALRELLRKRHGIRVLSIPYKSKSEEQRVFEEIKEAVEQ